MITAPESLSVGFTLASAALVFLMQAGFCLLESGMVRTKNSINVAVKNLLDCAIAMTLFSVCGFSLMFGLSHSGFIGSFGSVDYWTNDRLLTFFLFQAVFCSTAATIVSGAVAERTKLGAYLFTVVVLSALVYPIVGHWIWGGALIGTTPGWLASLGFVDWAGCIVVHAVGGFGALAAAQVIGRRRHMSNRAITSGHSLTLAILGSFLLWFGWWGFNGGSGLHLDATVPTVLFNTNLGAVAGVLVGALWGYVHHKRVEVNHLIIRVLAGLVSVTGACHAISPFWSFVAGAIGSWIALVVDRQLPKWGIDDAVSAFPVHGAAGIWGSLVFGLFAPTAALQTPSRLGQIGVQLLGSVVASVVAYTAIYGALKLLGRFTRLRVRAGEEHLGLNMAEHGASNEVIDLLGAMHNYRQTGDFSQRIDADAHTEVGQVAREYNRVLERVEQEVVEHEETNQWLQSERIRLQSVLEHVGVGIYQLDARGEIISANPTLLGILGLPSVVELQGSAAGFLPWHDHESSEYLTLQERFQQGAKVTDLETRIVCTDGQEMWLLESLVPIRDQDGVLLNWLGTMHDVTERKQAMLAEVEIAEAKSEAKGAFLANMSHEIRTPLNGVIGMLDLLGNEELAPTSDHFVTVARSSAETLLALINDILDFSKIEAGRLELESIDFKLGHLIEETAEQFAIRAHQKNLELNCELSPDLPHIVQGDPERLRQIIVNLLGNAIKFTSEGEINLRVSRRGTQIQFAIQDTGIGMTKEVQRRLFESFTQADASTTREYGGTGLGLAISNELVDLMGGRINVSSVVGEGSEFSFALNLPIVELNEPPNDKLRDFMSHLADRRVLVVDDNATNCEILMSQLTKWGMDVTICHDPTTVVERLLIARRLEREFDLIILDFCMPKMDGRDVAQAIRMQDSLGQTPIILLSSNYELMSREELNETGIQEAMTKPARQSRLLDSVMSVLHERDRQGASANRLRDAAPPCPFQRRASDKISIDDELPATPPLTQVPANTPNAPNALNTPQAPAQPRQPNRPPSPVANSQIPKTAPLVQANPIAPEPTPIPAQASTPPVAHTDADVLVAEDNQVNQLVVTQMLATLGCRVDVAENGAEAFEQVKLHRYQLILMDGHMPVLDGLAATKKIREWESATGTQGTPIVALTANVLQGVRQECLDAGMNGYLSKPITLPNLRRIVEQYVKPAPQPPAGQPNPNASTVATPPPSEPQETYTATPTVEQPAMAMQPAMPVHSVTPTPPAVAPPVDLPSRDNPRILNNIVAEPQRPTFDSPATAGPFGGEEQWAEEELIVANSKPVNNESGRAPESPATDVAAQTTESRASSPQVDSTPDSLAPSQPADTTRQAENSAPAGTNVWDADEYQSPIQLLNQQLLFEQCGGDHDFAKQILRIMYDSLPARLHDMETAFETNDLIRVKSMAHQLKGAAGDSSLQAIFETASTLEADSHKRDINAVGSGIRVLRHRVEGTLTLLEEILAS